jgi:hypothetical protein
MKCCGKEGHVFLLPTDNEGFLPKKKGFPFIALRPNGSVWLLAYFLLLFFGLAATLRVTARGGSVVVVGYNCFVLLASLCFFVAYGQPCYSLSICRSLSFSGVLCGCSLSLFS